MIGIDAVDIERLRGLLERVPAAEQRLFSEAERNYCNSHSDPALHFAGTLATKEAVIKARSLGPLVSWCRRIEVKRNGTGAPVVTVHGSDDEVHASISHDKGLAVAVAVAAESRRKPIPTRAGMRPNAQLMSYLARS